MAGQHLTFSPGVQERRYLLLRVVRPQPFVRQFGYDQLYVGNLNINLAVMGSLIDGACAWRYFITSCTEARLCMPLRTPNLLMTLGFY